MKRGSIVGPMILIGFGLLFLVRNMIPDFPVIDVVSRFWPLLLILWGGLRLLEVLYLAAMARPLPRAGISGGEWMLVILVCLVGGGMNAAYRNREWLPNQRATLHGFLVNMGESFDYPMSDTEQPCPANCRVVVENFRGNAKIVGADIKTVKLSGRKSIRSFEQSDADKANTETPAELVVQGDQIIVRTNQSRVNDTQLVSSDLELQVPFNTSIEAHGSLGDFDIQDIKGNVDITSDNAGVRLEKIGGMVRVETRRSDIIRATDVKGTLDLKGHGQDVELTDIAGQVTVNGSYVGQIQLRNLMQPVRYEDPQVTLSVEKLPGEMHMARSEVKGENLIGPVRLIARGRDIQLTNFTQSLELNLDRGDIQMSPGKTIPKMDVKIAHSGDIELGLPEKAKFDLKASTEHGEAHNDYGDGLTVRDQHHGATIVSEGSDSGPQIRLDTARGTLTVRKGDSDEAAATPPSSETPAPVTPARPRALSPPVRIEDQ